MILKTFERTENRGRGKGRGKDKGKGRAGCIIVLRKCQFGKMQ